MYALLRKNLLDAGWRGYSKQSQEVEIWPTRSKRHKNSCVDENPIASSTCAALSQIVMNVRSGESCSSLRAGDERSVRQAEKQIADTKRSSRFSHERSFATQLAGGALRTQMEPLVVAYCFSPSLRIKRRRLTYVLLAAAKRSVMAALVHWLESNTSCLLRFQIEKRHDSGPR